MVWSGHRNFRAQNKFNGNVFQRFYMHSSVELEFQDFVFLFSFVVYSFAVYDIIQKSEPAASRHVCLSYIQTVIGMCICVLNTVLRNSDVMETFRQRRVKKFIYVE